MPARFLAVGGAEFGCAIDSRALGLYDKRSRRARSSEQQSVASVSLKAHVCSLWSVVQLLLQFYPGQICETRAVGCFVVCIAAAKFKVFDRPLCLDPNEFFLLRGTWGGSIKWFLGKKKLTAIVTLSLS